MAKLKHKGCSTPIFEYHGSVPLMDGPLMRAADWSVLGVRCKFGGFMPTVNCPDCGDKVGLHPSMLETSDGSPHRYKPKPIQKQKTLLERLKALFSFLGL